MWPILFSVGNFHLYSLSVFVILEWLTFSFVFWRQMTDYGVEEDKIYDLTFYGTLVALVVSRLTYVFLNWTKFGDNLLKISVIWVYPGMSLYGAIVGSTLFMVFLVRKYKIRLGYVLDSLAWAWPYTVIVGLIGAFLDGSRVGKPVIVAWAVRYIGYPDLRHPVQVYEIISLLAILGILALLSRRAQRQRWPYGMIGVWFFLLFGLTQFMLEFLKVNSIYWVGLSFNQWVSLAIICESSGALYIKAGGKSFLRKIFTGMRAKSQNSLKGVYHAISERITRKNKTSS